MSILLNKNVAESIETGWKPEINTLFYVVDRKHGGIVSKYKVGTYATVARLDLADIYIYRPRRSSVSTT